MNTPARGPIDEDDLMAFVDNRLPDDRRAEVQRQLDTHPDDAERVEPYRAQRLLLRAAVPIPAQPSVRLNPHALFAARQFRRRLVWRAAVVVLALGLGGAGGWTLRGTLTPARETDLAVLVREAVANHVVYTADQRRPTELGADQRDVLARWVSGRLNHRVVPPDLSDSGYGFIGGRLAATPEGPAGLFVYQNDAGVRLTVFVRPDPAARNAPLAPVPAKPMGGAAWIDKGVGYSVVAPVPTAELQRLAERVRRLLESAG